VSEYRIERDPPGEVKVPRGACRGAPVAAAEKGISDKAELQKSLDVRGMTVRPENRKEK
jgi:hypothetical protein